MALLSFKVVLISTGMLSMAVILKLSSPLVADFMLSNVPSVWSSLLSWLRPPYLYLIMNCIIISIVASSKLQHKLENKAEVGLPEQPEKVPAYPRTEFTSYGGGVVANGYMYSDSVSEDVAANAPEVEKNISYLPAVETDKDDAAAISPPVSGGLQRNDSVELLSSDENGRPPVSSRFGHRRAVKPNPEAARALRVSKSKRNDTLENTWKTITEGRSMPLSRHLKKSDTWETQGRRNPPASQMKKSETFNDRIVGGADSVPESGRVRREPSLSQDELNRRVEAFIQKFNEEMRLQRQESLNQYQEMLNLRA